MELEQVEGGLLRVRRRNRLRLVGNREIVSYFTWNRIYDKSNTSVI